MSRNVRQLMSLQPSLFDPMPLDTIIPPTRLVRTNDPHTSHETAKDASRRGPSQRRRVWETLKHLGDATDYELSEHLGILRGSAAKRRQELVDLGHVVETPFKRKTDTGSLAIVWRLSLVSPHYPAEHPSKPTPSTTTEASTEE